jgi:hypothetical protein
MAKRDMKKALGASLKAEEQAVRSRFEKARAVPGKTVRAGREQPKPEATDQIDRDSFNIADDEDELISRIRKRCVKAGLSPDRSEVLSAGLAALDAMGDRELRRVFENLQWTQTGTPGREILTFIVRHADVIKFRRRLQIKRYPPARKVLIGKKFATITEPASGAV